MIVEIEQNHRYDTFEKRWVAVREKDPDADGQFFFAVKTTRIYCQPTCASRLPNPANVDFFLTAQAAEAAGFRPCKRCRPDQPPERSEQAERIVQACAIIAQADTCPSLQTLAQSVGLSPFYFQRLFHRLVGLTPKQYFAQKRAERVRAALSNGETVTEALYNAGYGSSAQFYSQAAGTLGMKPGQYRNGGQGTEIRYAIQPCFLGWVLIAATQTGLCAIEFGDHPEDLEQALKERFPGADYLGEDPVFTGWVKDVLTFLEQPDRGLNLPLDIQGTAFQRKVWMALQAIPSGARVSYTEIARRIGQPKATRAVAQACARNRLAVAIPCHRVVRENGGLGGYRWGIDRKRQLLERERERS